MGGVKMESLHTSNTKILYVQTFREFSLTYGGNALVGLSRYGNTQPEVLLQILLHNRPHGVSRRTLMRELFDERDVLDAAHSLHVLLYNLRVKLRKAGLPDSEYIRRDGEMYYWTEAIPVEEDAERFEQLCSEAAETESPENRKRLYTEACNLYRGEFLEDHSATWVLREAKRYERLYGVCVEALAQIAREELNYTALEALGRQAATAQPFWGWERLTMEGMLGEGRLWNARQLYFAIERYYRESDMPMDERIQALYDQCRPMDPGAVPSPDRLLENLSAQSENGGYVCSYAAFTGLCEMAKRWNRNGMLLTATISAGGEQTVTMLLRSLRSMLRPCDALTHTDDEQIMIFLSEASEQTSWQWQQRLTRYCRENSISLLGGWQTVKIGVPPVES